MSLCAACNRPVHSRYTLALGKSWHTYHFTCFICRVVLQADDNYQETAEGITCGDCIKIKARTTVKGNGGENEIVYEEQISPPQISLLPTSVGDDGKRGEDVVGLSTNGSQPDEPRDTPGKENKIDAESMYSEDFYRPRYSKPSSSSRFDFMDFSTLSPSFSHTQDTDKSESSYTLSLSSSSSSSFSLSSSHFSVVDDRAPLSDSIESFTKDSGSLNSSSSSSSAFSPRIDHNLSSHSDLHSPSQSDCTPTNEASKYITNTPTTTDRYEPSTSANELSANNDLDISPREFSQNTNNSSTNGWDTPARERSASATGWSSPNHHNSNSTNGWGASLRERSASANGWSSPNHLMNSNNSASLRERNASTTGWRVHTHATNGGASLRERSASATWSTPNRHSNNEDVGGVSLRERSASATWSAPNHTSSLSPSPKPFTTFNSNPLVDAIRSRMDAPPNNSPPKLFTPQLDRTPQPSPTSYSSPGLRPLTYSPNPRVTKPRYGKYAKTTFSFESPSGTVDVHSQPEEPKEIPKRPQINPSSTKNRRFDFEYKDKDAPQPSENLQNTFPTEDPPNSTDPNNLYKLIDDQAYLSATLLDTSDDMKGRSRTASGARRLPPSMSIRVNVPTPSHPKKSDPRSPTSSPSPPLSLPSSPSPPPLFSTNNSSHTPPTSPRLARKPVQYTNSPPVLTPTLSRSGSPPLSLPEAPIKDVVQLIRAKIEEEIVRAVMEDAFLGNTSDTTPEKANSLGNVAGGTSSSSLMARKRRIKQAHKEATLHRQLSLHKQLIQEVQSASGSFNLRPAVTSAGSKSSRQELIDTIRAFSITWLKKAILVENVSAHTQHMRDIRAFAKSNRRLRQVVGKTTASALLPTITNLMWKGKQCFGVTFRDVQFLLRDPAAVRDISDRLALRYRAEPEPELDVKNVQIGSVDCIVAIPHEAAIAFGSRLALSLRVPLQILQQRPCNSSTPTRGKMSYKQALDSFSSSSSSKQSVSFASGRGLYAAGVETLQSRGADEYELWLTQRNCIKPHTRCVVVDDALDNGSPIIAAMMILRSAGARVLEMVTIVEYPGFGGRDRISQTCQNIGLNPHPNVHTCLSFNDNPDMK